MKKHLRTLTLVLGGALLLGFILLAINTVNTQQLKLEFDNVEIKSEQVKIKLLDQKYKELLESDKVNQDKLKQLEAEKAKLEKDLQAKNAEKARIAAKKKEAERVATLQPKRAQASSVSFSGNKDSWLRASGIPQSQWWAVDSIVSRESGWNPNAVNPSSGACGLGQQLPCGKWPGAWNDPVAALKAQYNYVKARYGGYPQAVAFWNTHHWY